MFLEAFFDFLKFFCQKLTGNGKIHFLLLHFSDGFSFLFLNPNLNC